MTTPSTLEHKLLRLGHAQLREKFRAVFAANPGAVVTAPEFSRLATGTIEYRSAALLYLRKRRDAKRVSARSVKKGIEFRLPATQAKDEVKPPVIQSQTLPAPPDRIAFMGTCLEALASLWSLNSFEFYPTWLRRQPGCVDKGARKKVSGMHWACDSAELFRRIAELNKISRDWIPYGTWDKEFCQVIRDLIALGLVHSHTYYQTLTKWDGRLVLTVFGCRLLEGLCKSRAWLICARDIRNEVAAFYKQTLNDRDFIKKTIKAAGND